MERRIEAKLKSQEKTVKVEKSRPGQVKVVPRNYQEEIAMRGDYYDKGAAYMTDMLYR